MCNIVSKKKMAPNNNGNCIMFSKVFSLPKLDSKDMGLYVIPIIE